MGNDTIMVIMLLGAVLLTPFVVILVKLGAINRERVVKLTGKAEDQLIGGKPAEALKTLYPALRTCGWDYQTFTERKKVDRLATIRDVEPALVKIAKLFSLAPKNNLAWVMAPFRLLADVYQALNMDKERIALLNDLRNFLEDYGTGVNRVRRAEWLAWISHEQAILELKARSYQSVILLEADRYLHLIEHLHAADRLADIDRLFPYQPTPVLTEALAGMKRPNEAEEIGKIIQGGIVDGGARIDIKRVQNDLTEHWRGQNTRSTRDQEMAQMIYERVLEKT